MPSKHQPDLIEPIPDTPPAFKGFRPGAFAFFKNLATHQNRDWFAANKPIYDQQVLAPMTALVNHLGEMLRLRRIPLQPNAKSAIFRIYRDLRFSKDKSPYKTHVATALARYGKNINAGGLYLHVEPAGCFIACRFYQPEPDVLAKNPQRNGRAWRGFSTAPRQDFSRWLHPRNRRVSAEASTARHSIWRQQILAICAQATIVQYRNTRA